MKILILADKFPPEGRGGAARVVFDLVRKFSHQNHEVYVITTTQCKENEKLGEVFRGLAFYKIYVPSYKERWRAYLSLYNPKVTGKVKKVLKEIKADVVHVHNIHYYLSYHLLKLAKRYTKAVFLTAHDVMLFNYGKLATKKYLEKFDYRTNWFDHLKQAQKRYNPFRNIVIRYYLKYVDKIFAVSQALKDALNQNGIKNVEVIYNGIDVEDWEIDSKLIEDFKKKYNLQNKKVILFIGRISQLKGRDQIKTAMEKVKKEVKEAILFTPGAPEVGWLVGDELKAAYHSAEVVVIPSICFDSFPTTSIEGMACQKPVVGTCYGGTPEIVQDGVTGYIVNPFDTELMSAKILDLLKNPRKARQFGGAGYQRVKKHFNLDSQAAQTLDWYQKLISVKE